MECVACSTCFLDPLNPPIAQTCKCAARVCIECRHQVPRCPFCRERTLGTTIDPAYVTEVQTMARSVRCEGCNKSVSTRTAREHFATCPDYLRGRILEGRVDRMKLASAYRDTSAVNQDLRARNYQLQEQIQMFFNSMAPAPPHPPQHSYEPRSPPGPPPQGPPPPVGPVRIYGAGTAADHRLLHR